MRKLFTVGRFTIVADDGDERVGWWLGRHAEGKFLGDFFATDADLRHITRLCAKALKYRQVTSRAKARKPKPSLVSYPADRPARYNGSNEKCDMLVGPCCCGAWHHGDDDPLENTASKADDTNKTRRNARHQGKREAR